MAYDRVLATEEDWLLSLKSRRVLWIIPIIAILYFGWLLFLLSTSNPPVLEVSTWALIGTVLFLALLVFEAALLVRTQVRPIVHPGTAATYDDDLGEAAAYEVPPPKGVAREDQDVVEWPPDRGQGGLYTTHHVRVSDDLVLEKRTFAVRPCAFCEHRESCFENDRFYERMGLPAGVELDREEFLDYHGCTYGMEPEETL